MLAPNLVSPNLEVAVVTGTPRRGRKRLFAWGAVENGRVRGRGGTPERWAARQLAPDACAGSGRPDLANAACRSARQIVCRIECLHFLTLVPPLFIVEEGPLFIVEQGMRKRVDLGMGIRIPAQIKLVSATKEHAFKPPSSRARRLQATNMGAIVLCMLHRYPSLMVDANCVSTFSMALVVMCGQSCSGCSLPRDRSPLSSPPRVTSLSASLTSHCFILGVRLLPMDSILVQFLST